jgi:hypothetical protein
MVIAFNAGVAFADAERTKEFGRKQNDKSTMSLHLIFEKADAAARAEQKRKRECNKITPAAILQEIDLAKVKDATGRVLANSTLLNKIAVWQKR